MKAELEQALGAPFGTIAGLIRQHALQAPARRALVQDGQVLTYAELDAQMDRVAAALQRDGVQPGEVIAICAGTSPAYAVTYLGALRAEVEASLRKVEQLVNEVNRLWPFARDTELKLR